MRAGVLVSSELVAVSISRSIDCRKLGPVPGVFTISAGRRRVDEGPASELRLESEAELDDCAPFSATRLVRGLFRGRSVRAGGSASEGEVVADFLFVSEKDGRRSLWPFQKHSKLEFPHSTLLLVAELGHAERGCRGEVQFLGSGSFLLVFRLLAVSAPIVEIHGAVKQLSETCQGGQSRRPHQRENPGRDSNCPTQIATHEPNLKRMLGLDCAADVAERACVYLRYCGISGQAFHHW